MKKSRVSYFTVSGLTRKMRNKVNKVGLDTTSKVSFFCFQTFQKTIQAAFHFEITTTAFTIEQK